MSLTHDVRARGAIERVLSSQRKYADLRLRQSQIGLTIPEAFVRGIRHIGYRPVPGRQLLILIRNAARQNRPVIGIAMLASPVMRVGVRDKWIGWLREETEARLRDGSWEPSALGAALFARLEESIAAIRWDDLATAAEIAEPTESTVLRLEQKASGAAFARDLELRAHYEAHREAGEKITPMRGVLKHAAHDADPIALLTVEHAQLISVVDLSMRRLGCAALVIPLYPLIAGLRRHMVPSLSIAEQVSLPFPPQVIRSGA